MFSCFAITMLSSLLSFSYISHCDVSLYSLNWFPHPLPMLFNRCKTLYYSTTGQLSIEDVPTMILCKPKLLPLKSVTLEKLEKMQMEAQEAVRQQELATKEQLQ